MTIVEADKACSDQAALEFVSEWRMPSLFKPRLVNYFRETVVGQSLTVEEAQGLVADMPLTGLRIFKPSEGPIFVISAVKSRELEEHS
jgi:hypothetical protein